MEEIEMYRRDSKLKIQDYTVFDIETPNRNNTSLCSISIVNVKDGKIVFKKEYLVNPEENFDDFNIKLTGITPKMVENEPTFDKVWEEIKDFFISGIVVGHNINTFDLRVVCNLLNKYNIMIPDIYFIDTLYVSRKVFIGFENYKLSTLCKRFNIINENSHNSLCDSLVTQKLFEKILETNNLNESDIRLYNYSNNCNKVNKNQINKSMNNIYGILKGITADKQLNNLEIQNLKNWINENKEKSNVSIFNKIITTISKVIEDNTISIEEKIMLLNLINEYLPKGFSSKTTSALQILMGIIEGITCDNELNIKEIVALKNWMLQNDFLKGFYPFDEIFKKLNDILDDNILTEEEAKQTMKIFKDFLNPLDNSNLCLNENLNFNEKNVCLTGTFTHGSKSDIELIIENKGGRIKSNVTSTLDILIVGEEGSKDWSYGTFGSKIKKAMEFNEKGKNIQIISESQFF